MSLQVKTAIIVSLTLIGVIVMMFAVPQQLPAEVECGVVFVRLHMTPEGISLVEYSCVSGQLKQPRESQNIKEITWEAMSSSDSVITKGSLDNPLIRRFEYEDPNNPGNLVSRTVELNEAYFVIRMPFSYDIKSLSFYRKEHKSGDPSDMSSSKLISRMDIDLKAVSTFNED